ncbi:hypothetical protein D3C73_932150 [compost metagenome]
MVAVLAVALDDGDLDDVAGQIDTRLVAGGGQAVTTVFGDDFSGHDADDRGFRFRIGDAELHGLDGTRLDAVKADRGDRLAGGEKLVGDTSAAGKDYLGLTVFERVDDD